MVRCHDGTNFFQWLSLFQVEPPDFVRMIAPVLRHFSDDTQRIFLLVDESVVVRRLEIK